MHTEGQEGQVPRNILGFSCRWTVSKESYCCGPEEEVMNSKTRSSGPSPPLLWKLPNPKAEADTLRKDV